MDVPDFDGLEMVDTLFPFIDPIVDPTEEDWFHFVAQIESLFDSPEQFMSEYETWSAESTISEPEKQKKLDLYIGLSLIGQRGREQMYTRLRMKRDTHHPS